MSDLHTTNESVTLTHEPSTAARVVNAGFATAAHAVRDIDIVAAAEALRIQTREPRIDLAVQVALAIIGEWGARMADLVPTREPATDADHFAPADSTHAALGAVRALTGDEYVQLRDAAFALCDGRVPDQLPHIKPEHAVALLLALGMSEEAATVTRYWRRDTTLLAVMVASVIDDRPRAAGEQPLGMRLWSTAVKGARVAMDRINHIDAAVSGEGGK